MSQHFKAQVLRAGRTFGSAFIAGLAAYLAGGNGLTVAGVASVAVSAVEVATRQKFKTTPVSK